jgi:hypothetical protein
MLKKVKTFNDLVDYHKDWTANIEFGYHKEITDLFGEDMTEIFGPKAIRKSVRLLSTEEKESKINAVKKYTNTDLCVHSGRLIIDHLGVVSYVEMLKMVFAAYKTIIDPLTGQPVFYGVQLDAYDYKDAFVNGVLVPQDLVNFNVADIQRPTSLIREISICMGNFDSACVYGMKARLDSDIGGVISSDGLQGSTVLGIQGVMTLPVGFTPREGLASDADILLTCGADALQMSDYDIYKARVTRAVETAKASKEENIKPEDLSSYYLDKIVSQPKSKIEFRPEASVIGQDQCNTVSQYQKLFRKYCKEEFKLRENFEKAIHTMRIAWPKKPITSEAVWALTELYTQMDSKQRNVKDIEHTIANILARKWKKGYDVWGDTSEARKYQYPTKDKNGKTLPWKDHYFNAGEDSKGYMMAAAIVELCHNTTCYDRTQAGHKTVKDLDLPVIKNSDGQVFDINMSCITGDNKAFVRPDKKPLIVTESMKEVVNTAPIVGISVTDVQEYLNA